MPRIRATGPIFLGSARAFNAGDDVPPTWLEANIDTIPGLADLVELVDEEDQMAPVVGVQPTEVPLTPPVEAYEQPASDAKEV